MSDLIAVDILIDPDPATIARAKEINERMLQSVPEGFSLDATHVPHITMLQRYLRTDQLDQAYAAIAELLAKTDPATLAYDVDRIIHSDHWGPPGQAAAVLRVLPSEAMLTFQADLLDAVTPFMASGGTSAAFVSDPGEEISDTTKAWVETFVPDQFGPKYTAHLTVGVATDKDLEVIEAEPFDAFTVHAANVAVYHLGNNGTARTQLKAWPVGTPA